MIGEDDSMTSGPTQFASDDMRDLKTGDGVEPQTAESLLPLVYNELRRLATQRLAQEKPGLTLQATALVHEAYLRIVGDSDEPRWENLAHFFAAAAEAMRRILVENARGRARLKRGGEFHRVELLDDHPAIDTPAEEILAVDDALSRLADEDPEAAEIVKLRYFAGLSIDDAARSLGISRASAYRHWTYARAWIRCDILGGK
jgi:RNA polymerase sigma factor (TIGR02999 family)